MVQTPQTLARYFMPDRSRFDAVIDVRSPAEFADDHIPGAINLPVLSDDERARVGTIYKQVNPFEARKVGAALVSRNIARHLDEHFIDKPKEYRPLVYCWRGGQRSGSMAIILNQIGFRTTVLNGGYKTYRGEVMDGLREIVGQFNFRVLAGRTGSGKSHVLRELAALNGQVLDLEALAVHRGSLLGSEPGRPQPPQRLFESLLYERL